MTFYVQVKYSDGDADEYIYDTYRVFVSQHAIIRSGQRLDIYVEDDIQKEIEEILSKDNVMDIFLNGIPCNGSQVIIRDIQKNISLAVVHQLSDTNEPEIAIKTVGTKLDVGNGQLSIRIYNGLAKLYRWFEVEKLFKEVEVEF